MKPASNKQINFASRINIITGIPLPEEKTAQAYFIYIRDNIDEYRRKRPLQGFYLNPKDNEFLIWTKRKMLLGRLLWILGGCKKEGDNYETLD